MFKKKLTFQEILLGLFGGYLSYILIAVFNISNEDLYNWDVELILSEGGFSNGAALIAFWLWFAIVVVWLASVGFRLIKQFFKRI